MLNLLFVSFFGTDLFYTETTSACTGTSEENGELLATDDCTALSPGTSLSSNGSCSSDDGSDGKSEISKVHELALQHSLTITFEVIHESGPPHLRNFLTRFVSSVPLVTRGSDVYLLDCLCLYFVSLPFSEPYMLNN